MNRCHEMWAVRIAAPVCVFGVCLSASAADVAFPRDAAACIVASPQTPLEHRLVGRLADYLGRVLRKPAQRVTAMDHASTAAPVILLAIGKSPVELPVLPAADSPESYALATVQARGHPVVAAVGATEQGLKRAIQRLIIESRQEPGALVFPHVERADRPWIPQREWTVCPWSPRYVRGVFVNPRADLRMDINRYSDRQLAGYAEMFDWFGYNGCQLMETAYSYAACGSVEAFQDWQRRLAEAVRSNGQAVSLWVWAAQFSGFDWYDPEVIAVSVPDKGAFEDPATRKVFEKYYDGYARLAPLVDRVIGHFYDPGVLADRADVFKYMKLLESKFRAVNPGVKMGIDLWAADPQQYMQQMLDNGLGDYLVLESGFPPAFPADARRKLHEHAKAKGIHLGVWGWYMTEYETDQLASLYVNARLLKNLYHRIREAHGIHPVTYWSEMEAHHLNNIYSMYTAGQLLWNPDKDPHELLKELVLALWGPKNGPAVLDAVELIQDMRSGPTWDTYWWGLKSNRIGSDYPADDLRRTQAALSALSGMKTDPDFVPKFPLPFPPETFVELMLPHLHQIRLYAEFRLAVEGIRKAARKGADTPALQKMFDQAWKPIPEFDTWVGVFGTPEFRAQDRLARTLCDELKLTINDPPWLRHLEADRAYQFIQSRQRATNRVFQFPSSGLGEFFWHPAKVENRLQKLLEDGLIERTGEGKFQLKR